MKKLRLIYNPFSGDRAFGSSLDACIKILQGYGWLLCPVRIDDNINIEDTLTEDFDAFGVSGGDGTINIVLNAIMNKGLDHIPLGVFPSGTANDFASYMRLPKAPEDICHIIGRGNTTRLDVGKAGDKYFINVCAGGLFSDISTTIDNDLKAVIGKMAYYGEAIRQITEYKPLNLKITDSRSCVYEESVCLFLSLNSSGTGGIKNITPEADMQDGLLDFIFIKDCELTEIPNILIGYMMGTHTENKNIIYFKDRSVRIECSDSERTETDVDGEKGDSLPLTIESIPKAIKLFI